MLLLLRYATILLVFRVELGKTRLLSLTPDATIDDIIPIEVSRKCLSLIPWGGHNDFEAMHFLISNVAR